MVVGEVGRSSLNLLWHETHRSEKPTGALLSNVHLLYGNCPLPCGVLHVWFRSKALDCEWGLSSLESCSCYERNEVALGEADPSQLNLQLGITALQGCCTTGIKPVSEALSAYKEYCRNALYY